MIKIASTILAILFLPYLANGAYTVTQVTNNNYSNYAAVRNSSGQAVWLEQNNGRTDVFLWNGSTKENLSDGVTGSSSCANPQINSSGQVVWSGRDNGTDSEIFLYDGSTVTQITDNSTNDITPQIDASGVITWFGWDGNDWEVYTAQDQ